MEAHKHDSLEQWLHMDLVQVPDGFTGRVMQQIHTLPLPAAKSLEWLQWLALAGGVLVGIGQLVGFVFGVWALSTAG
jgi:hypothetical protein